MKKIYHILFAAAAIALSAAASETQYKVESFNGAPFITENGKPLRNRIVWVAGGCGESLNHPLLKKANVWKETELEFEAPNDLPAIVQLRMGKSAGEIYFSKWEISESESGKVVFSLDTASDKPDKNIAHWCAGFREDPPVKLENTTTDDGERALKLTLGGGKKLEAFHLYVNSIPVGKGKKYKVKLRAKSDAPRPFSTSIYYYDNKFMFVKSDTSIAASTIKHAAKAGVDFVSFEINSVWTKPDEKPDFKYIDSAFGVFLEANPKAKLIPRVRLDPQINKWWRDSHPDDIMKNSDGTLNETYVSVSSPAYRREGSVGRPIPGLACRLSPVPGITEENTGVLWVKGDNVMLGYMRFAAPGVLEPPVDEALAERFALTGEGDDGSGWYETGDIVHMDEDGFIFIRGRAKRFAKIGGEMVSLAAVEDALKEIWPESMLGVVAIPDPRKGEQLALVIDTEDVTTSRIAAHFASRGLSPLWTPKRIVSVKQAPLLGSGKFDYRKARELAEKG